MQVRIGISLNELIFFAIPIEQAREALTTVGAFEKYGYAKLWSFGDTSNRHEKSVRQNKSLFGAVSRSSL